MRNILILFPLFCGCLFVSLGPSELYLDSEVGLRAQTVSAVEAVNKELGAKLLFAGPHKDAVRIVEGGAECGGFDHKGTITVARTCERFGADALTVVIVHEIGHALGLEHSQDESSVMHERYLIGMTVDEAAASLVQELQVQGTILLPPNEVQP